MKILCFIFFTAPVFGAQIHPHDTSALADVDLSDQYIAHTPRPNNLNQYPYVITPPHREDGETNEHEIKLRSDLTISSSPKVETRQYETTTVTGTDNLPPILAQCIAESLQSSTGSNSPPQAPPSSKPDSRLAVARTANAAKLRRHMPMTQSFLQEANNLGRNPNDLKAKFLLRHSPSMKQLALYNCKLGFWKRRHMRKYLAHNPQISSLMFDSVVISPPKLLAFLEDAQKRLRSLNTLTIRNMFFKKGTAFKRLALYLSRNDVLVNINLINTDLTPEECDLLNFGLATNKKITIEATKHGAYAT